MADQDIKISFTTTADTSGADQTLAAVAKIPKPVDDAARAARRLEYETRRTQAAAERIEPAASRGFGGMLDQVEKATEAVEKHTDALDDAAAAAEKPGKALSEIFTGKALSAKDLPPVGPEVDKTLASLQNLKSAALELGSAVALVYGTLTSAFGEVRRSYDELAAADPAFAEKTAGMRAVIETLSSPMQALKDAWGDMKTAAMDAMTGGAASLVEQVAASYRASEEMKEHSQSLLAEHLKTQEAMKKAVDDRMQHILDLDARYAANQLANQRSLLAAQGPANPATPDGAGRMITGMSMDEQGAERQLEEARRAYANATAAAMEVSGVVSGSAESIRAAVDTAKNAVDMAENDLTSMREVGMQRLRTAAETASSGFEGDVTKEVEELEKALSIEVDRLGGAATGNAKEGLRMLQSIMQDKQVTADEVGQLDAAWKRVNASQEARNGKVLSALQSVAATEDAHARTMETITRKFDELSGKVNRIDARMRTLK